MARVGVPPPVKDWRNTQTHAKTEASVTESKPMKRQPLNSMCRTAGPKATLTVLAATLSLGAALVMPARASNLNPPTGPGGIQITPEIVGTPVVNGSIATLTIKGLQAPYMIQVSSNGSDWQNAGVTSLKHPNFSGTCTATNVPQDVALFRLMMLGSTNWVGKWNAGALAITNIFQGANKCNGCHGNEVTSWAATKHAAAYLNATNFPIESRVVGSGQPGGFVDLSATPHLANVQCESCHGNANAHVNLSGRTYHPVASINSKVCGSCHDTEESPIYEEWLESPHSHQHATILSYFTGSSGVSRQASCGACHSTATRMAMLSNYEDMKKGITNALVIPSALEATNYATASCVVCHDPHATNGYAAQLRYPLRSTNFFTLTTTTSSTTKYYTNVLGQITTNVVYANTPFASQYNPNIQVCGQCHNTRGASWQDYSRPPHHSLQYNMLIGIVQEGYLNTNALGVATNIGSRHSGFVRTSGVYNTNQCVTCHVVSYAVGQTNGYGADGVTPTFTTNYSGGHTFELDYEGGCMLGGCHNSVRTNRIETLKELVEHEQGIYKAGITNVLKMLTYWSTNVAPGLNPAFTNYGVYAWEYTTAGQLSNPTGTNTWPGTTNLIVGPPTSLQTNSLTGIPSAIKQARFNIYMIEHDGSYGLHNRAYGRMLINDASNKVLSVGGLLIP